MDTFRLSDWVSSPQGPADQGWGFALRRNDRYLTVRVRRPGHLITSPISAALVGALIRLAPAGPPKKDINSALIVLMGCAARSKVDAYSSTKNGAVMLELSVIICAHNPRPHYLRRVLEALQAQTLPKQQWELLLIDNLSSTPLVSDWELSWHPNGRHILESELGLTAARQRGIRESSATILVFVDDDNVLDANYLSTALSIGKEWPKLGTWGSGASIPEFELQPSEAAKEFFGYIAIREADVPRWGNVSAGESTPHGAGLCVRREVADSYCRLSEQSAIKITDRKGKSLLSCGDIEISYVARRDGLGTGVFPELRLIHLMPKERVSVNYLLKIYQASMTSYHLLAYNWNGSVPGHPLRPRALLSMLKNCVTKRRLDRRRYFADVRAVIEARRLIAECRTQG
jgi:glycosyltransferase involved in cell wall biosynthesis